MANTVKITFEVESKDLQASLEKIKTGLNSADSSVQKMSSSLRLIKWDAIVNLGERALGAARQLYDFSKSVATTASEIQRQAEIVGTNVENFQKLQYAAKMCNVTNEELIRSLVTLAHNMGEARKESGDARYYFEALGITMKDLKTKSPVDLLMKIADGFSAAADGSRKNEYAANLLASRFGDNLIPMLNKGSAGIKAYGDEAVKMGTILGDVVIKKGDEAEQTFVRLEARVNSLKVNLGPLILKFAELTEKIVDFINKSSIFSKEGKEKELKNLQDWLDYGLKQGTSKEFIEDYRRRIADLQKELGITPTSGKSAEQILGEAMKPGAWTPAPAPSAQKNQSCVRS